jgi:hypothetical protein
MKKSYSFISLLAVGIFMVSTFTTSNLNAALGGADKFGFPFVFFTVQNEGEITNNMVFNGFALLADLAICFTIAYTIMSLIYMLKVEKKTTNDTATFAH